MAMKNSRGKQQPARGKRQRQKATGNGKSQWETVKSNGTRETAKGNVKCPNYLLQDAGIDLVIVYAVEHVSDPGEEANALVAAGHGEGADVGGVDVDLGAGHVLDGGHHGLVVLLHEVLAAINIQLGQDLLGSQVAELTKMKIKYF